MLERMFDSLYIQGYTAALQDVISTFDNIQFDLKYHKQKQNYKTYKSIVKCMLDNRAILREEPDAFVRYNTKLKGYEVVLERDTRKK